MVPLEDAFEDVLAKAMRGQSLSSEQLGEQVGCEHAAVVRLLSGLRNDMLMCRLAKVLGLNADCLIYLADADSGPAIALPEGILIFNTPYPIPGYEEMTVNSYAICPPGSDKCYLIDAGADAGPVVCMARENSIDLAALFLTHTHRDHVAGCELLDKQVERIYSPKLEPYNAAVAVADRDRFEISSTWHLEARLTPGHSPGGTTYVLHGVETPVAFVGDTIFCLSMGKANRSYEGARAAICEEILSLPDDTLLCPGHGPVTTVGFEKVNNPFFA